MLFNEAKFVAVGNGATWRESHPDCSASLPHEYREQCMESENSTVEEVEEVEEIEEMVEVEEIEEVEEDGRLQETLAANKTYANIN